MSASYRLAGATEQQLSSILSYVAERDGTARALHVHGKFVEAFEHLAQWPDSGSTRPALTDDRFRWWPVFRWLVIYDSASRPIDILAVIHGARELDRLFRDEH